MKIKAQIIRQVTEAEKQAIERLTKLNVPKAKTDVGDGRIAILQNPDKPSLWGWLARNGKRVVQFVAAPAQYPFKWLGVAVNDMYISYAETEIEYDRTATFKYGDYIVTAYYKGNNRSPVGITVKKGGGKDDQAKTGAIVGQSNS